MPRLCTSAPPRLVAGRLGSDKSDGGVPVLQDLRRIGEVLEHRRQPASVASGQVVRRVLGLKSLVKPYLDAAAGCAGGVLDAVDGEYGTFYVDGNVLGVLRCLKRRRWDL
jgi:hypothetical protein